MTACPTETLRLILGCLTAKWVVPDARNALISQPALSKNNGNRYCMVYCLVKRKHFRPHMSKAADEQSCYCPRIYCDHILNHVSISRILCLACFKLKKWPPMPAKTKVVFSVSHFFVKKNNMSCTNYRFICFLSKYVLNRECIPETLMGRVVKLGLSQTWAALSYNKPTLHSKDAGWYCGRSFFLCTYYILLHHTRSSMVFYIYNIIACSILYVFLQAQGTTLTDLK